MFYCEIVIGTILGQTFVGRPVESGVAIDVCEMVEGLHAQQIGGRGRFPKHAGGHQRRQTFEVGRVHRHASLNQK